jgi:tetratricopeptide (TPR) repeat protein
VQERYKEALACTEQALKFNRRHWKIWQNCIRFCLSTKNFYKALNAIRILLRNDQFEGLNGHLLLKISEIFLEKYTEEAGLLRAEAEKHKKNLYRFFVDWTNCINDY